MSYRIDRALPSFAIVALLASATLAAPSIAFAQTAAAPAPADTAAGQKPIDRTEAQIKDMHDKLKITAAQDPQWEDFVKAERASAEEMSDLIDKRQKTSKAMNAVDDFKNYEAIAKAHEDGLEKIVPAFEKLYSAFSDDQKKMADAMFKGKGPGAGKKAS